VSQSIASLKAEQDRARGDRRRISKELRNAQRRTCCLKGKARQLTNDDLMAVLLMRRQETEARGRGAASSSTGETERDPPTGDDVAM
jgi:hypothetical protein